MSSVKSTRKQFETEDSDAESDAGASPSYSESDSDSVSSRSSSPGTLRIVCNKLANTPRKRIPAGLGTQSPSSQLQKPVRKLTEKGTKLRSSSTPTKSKKTKNASTLDSRKRRKVRSCHQRRRTKSERNYRAHKVTEAENNVALDAEIDKFLEEKAMKNNLTATNVKSIIKHVITNNMVQKMIMSTVKKKGNPDDSSDDEAYFEPKLTRARSKLLGEKSSSPPLWPLASPAKPKPAVSETHVLIQEDLPEDSSGDEEYLPKEAEAQSDDESSSVASHASDIGSPAVSGRKAISRRRQSSNQITSPKADMVFKTPPPMKPKLSRRIDSAISLRTRSKLPLNDTPLEEIESRFIPPDITTDMYDWGLSDNEDYLAFVQEFLRPKEIENDNHDDDEADPEYNIMEEEEEHDKEELRMDRAVKVSKKELNELVAELLEASQLTSGDELDETDILNFQTNKFPQNNAIDLGGGERSTGAVANGDAGLNLLSDSFETGVNGPKSGTGQKPATEAVTSANQPLASTTDVGHSKDEVRSSKALGISSNFGNFESSEPKPKLVLVRPLSPQVDAVSGSYSVEGSSAEPVNVSDNVDTNSFTTSTPCTNELFSTDDLKRLQYQLCCHTQLLAQTYTLTATRDEPEMKTLSRMSQNLIIELRNTKLIYGQNSILQRVPNLDYAWTLVNSWPIKNCSKSPLKKKILIEQFQNEINNDRLNEDIWKNGPQFYFPRHVLKVLLENPAFMNPTLLPKFYNQNNNDLKMKFTDSEDALLVYGVVQLQDLGVKNLKEQSRALAQYILTARKPDNIYYHIKNAKKICQKVSKIIKDYYSNGIVPESPSVPMGYPREVASPVISLAPNEIPDPWKLLIQDFMKPESFPPVIQNKIRKATSRPRAQASDTTSAKTNESILTTTFPIGSSVLQQLGIDSGLTALPVMNINGNPGGVYMIVPKLATMPREKDYSTCSEAPPTFESATESVVMEKSTELIDVKEPNNNEILSVVPVGKPFSIPGIDEDVVNFNALNTPLKKVVLDQFDNFSESPENTIEVVGNDQALDEHHHDKTRDDHSARTFGSKHSSIPGCESSESEVNLTDYEMENEDENDQFGDDGEIEVITLDSDSENVIKHANGQDAKIYSCVNETNKTDITKTSTSNTDSTEGTTSAVVSSAGSSQQNSSVIGAGNDDDEDDDAPKRKKVKTDRDVPEDYTGEKNVNVDDVDSKSKAKLPKLKKADKEPTNTPRNKLKKSQTTDGSPPKKRSSKGLPSEEMLTPDLEKDEDVCDAFLEAFLCKVRDVTEPRHPGLHLEFHKLLLEAGATNESEVELLPRIEIFFKDYPELFKEFSSFVYNDKEDLDGNDDSSEFLDNEEMEAELNFVRHLEKFAENCPQLKAKIIHKLKILNDQQSIQESDIVREIEPLLHGNLVMLSALQRLYPSVYRPQPQTEHYEFERVELEDAEDTEEPDIETIKLPEETVVPATNSCPCQCHENAVHAYAARVKHCHKCCVKFQDGKVFVHSGRISRPVNVELTSPTAARKILGGKYCTSCALQEGKEILTSTSHQLEVKDAPNVSTDMDMWSHNINVKNASPHCSKDTPTERKPDTVPPIVSEETQRTTDATDSKHGSKITGFRPWTIEEDRIVLNTCQSKERVDLAFRKVKHLLPHRDMTEIEGRYVHLISKLQFQHKDPVYES